MFACGFVRIWLDSNGTEKNSDLHMNDTGWANCIHCQCCTLSHWARTNKVVAKISFWLHQFNRKHHVHCITVGGYRIRDLVQCACINLLSFFFVCIFCCFVFRIYYSVFVLAKIQRFVQKILLCSVCVSVYGLQRNSRRCWRTKPAIAAIFFENSTCICMLACYTNTK